MLGEDWPDFAFEEFELLGGGFGAVSRQSSGQKGRGEKGE
jgi:hypothetical protein